MLLGSMQHHEHCINILRTLYNRLRNDFQLPSLATLGRMTSKVSKLNEKSFLLSIFNTLNTSQKGCLILHEVSVDNPSLLAQTVLGIMLIYLNGAPKFLTKLIPISKLTSAFLFKQIELTVQAITTVPADVKAIICDGN